LRGIVRSDFRPGGRNAARAADTAATNQTLEKKMNISELRAKKETLMNTMRNILDSATSNNRSLTTAEERDFDGLKVKVADIGATLDRASQLGEMRAEIERPIVSGPAPNGNGMNYVSRNIGPGEVRAYKPNEAIAEAPYVGPGIGAYVRGIVTGKWATPELRALAETSTPGSYLVPTPLANWLIDVMRNQTQVVRAGALTVPMETQTLKIARQLADVTAAWKAENAAISFSDANFETVTFTAQTLAAGSKISVEMIEDAILLDQVIGNSIGKSLALALDYAALYGAGYSSNQPLGIRNQSNVVTDLGSDAGYTLTDFSKFSGAVSTLMGNNFPGPFAAIYSARTAGELDNLQDSLRQPLHQPDLVAAMHKYVSNQVPNNLTHGSANTASDAFVGQFDHCMIGMRTSMVMEISRTAADSTGSAFTNAQVWIRAYLRADVQLAHPRAFNVLSGIL
jgi:HK97 family phage major capsid protein